MKFEISFHNSWRNFGLTGFDLLLLYFDRNLASVAILGFGVDITWREP